MFGVLWLALFHRDHAGLTPIYQHQLPVFDGLNLHVGAAAAACQREALPRLVVLIVAHDQRTPSGKIPDLFAKLGHAKSRHQGKQTLTSILNKHLPNIVPSVFA